MIVRDDDESSQHLFNKLSLQWQFQTLFEVPSAIFQNHYSLIVDHYNWKKVKNEAYASVVKVGEIMVLMVNVQSYLGQIGLNFRILCSPQTAHNTNLPSHGTKVVYMKSFLIICCCWFHFYMLHTIVYKKKWIYNNLFLTSHSPYTTIQTKLLNELSYYHPMHPIITTQTIHNLEGWTGTFEYHQTLHPPYQRW